MRRRAGRSILPDFFSVSLYPHCNCKCISVQFASISPYIPTYVCVLLFPSAFRLPAVRAALFATEVVALLANSDPQHS